jgi:hypothetical protein
MRRAPAVAVCLAGLLAVAGCGGGSGAHAASTQPPPAQCARAQAVAGIIGQIAQYFTSVASRGDVNSAALSVASDSSLNGSNTAQIAEIAAAKADAPASLADPLGQLSADYQALLTNVADFGAPSTIAQDATATVGDISKINSMCS